MSIVILLLEIRIPFLASCKKRISNRHAQNLVVSFLAVVHPEQAHDPGLNKVSGECGFAHYGESVGRISIFSERPGGKARSL